MFRYTLCAILFFISFLSCGPSSGRAKTSGSTTARGDVKVEKTVTYYDYNVVKSYPHNTDSYTQGLYWHDGHLWEGTGEYGSSALLKVELGSGKVLKRISLGERYFGEGVACLNGEIFQLTWNEERAFVYDAKTLKPKRQHSYTGSGWGLTTDGEQLYMSDGSSRIYVVDPEKFMRQRVIDVKLNGKSMRYINEMEWIEGRIWANVYMNDIILIINPATGEVEGVVDMRGILKDSDRTPDTDVLNGIAYDSVAKRVFVTGKNWSKLFEITITPKPTRNR